MARNLNTTTFKLPIGVADKEGNIHVDCTISEMVGSDEESIIDKKVASNPSNVITTLLARKIVSIGDITKITPALVKSMFTGDRDACLLEIRKLSLGDEMKFVTQCPSCKEKYDICIDLAKEIDTSTWSDKEEDELLMGDERGTFMFDLPVGYEDDGGEVHSEGLLKLPTGEIEEKLATMMRQNPAKANTALLCACIKTLGDLKMVDTKVLREMTRRDREYLTGLLRDAKCGPDFVREVECPYCGTSHKIVLELPYFFTANSDQ